MVESFTQIIHKLAIILLFMKTKEINQLIHEQTQAFFSEEGFKFSMKEMGYLKNDNDSRIRYGFSYVERRPIYYYHIYLYIRLLETEEKYSKVNGFNIIGETYVFPISYFIDNSNYINNNPKFLIEKPEDVQVFSNALIENYQKYVKDFVPFITDPKNMLDFLLSEIATGKRYANNENVFCRTLLLMKKRNHPGILEKLKEFKEKISHYADHIKEPYYQQMDNIVNENY